jgi:formate hydrogenlyase subunit 3/multisubunit Na+/H+ antiporter MnhD subunit
MREMFNLFSGSMVGYLICNSTINIYEKHNLAKYFKIYHSKEIKSAGFYFFVAVG